MPKISLVIMVFALLGAAAPDVHEYVNPVFCYRVVFPAGVTRMRAIRDNSGMHVDIGSGCSGEECSYIEFFALNNDSVGKESSSHIVSYLLKSGWRPNDLSSGVHQWGAWHVTSLAKGQLDTEIYERADGDAARYFLIAQFPDSKKTKFDKLLVAILASLRSVSECV